MSEFSNKMQTPHGDDQGREAPPPPPAGSTADQQGMPTGSYQQGLPPGQGGYQQNTPPGSYQPYGYQPYSSGPRQYGYQQPYGAPPMGDVGPFDRTSLGMRARTAGLLCYLFGHTGCRANSIPCDSLKNRIERVSFLYQALFDTD